MSLGVLTGAVTLQGPRNPGQLISFDGSARNQQIAQAVSPDVGGGALIRIEWLFLLLQGPPRTSSLQAPIMQLVGHDVRIYTPGNPSTSEMRTPVSCVQFNP
jgi:hypothetical protein